MTKLAKWIVTSFCAAVVFMTQISAESAVTNLASWYTFFGLGNPPALLEAQRIDLYVSMFTLAFCLFTLLYPTKSRISYSNDWNDHKDFHLWQAACLIKGVEPVIDQIRQGNLAYPIFKRIANAITTDKQITPLETNSERAWNRYKRKDIAKLVKRLKINSVFEF